MVEHVGAPEPLTVHKIVLCVAYPRRGEHLRHVLGSLRLHLGSLHGTRLYHLTVLTRDMLHSNLVIEAEALAKMRIRVGSPEDVLVGGVIEKQLPEHFGFSLKLE